MLRLRTRCFHYSQARSFCSVVNRLNKIREINSPTWLPEIPTASWQAAPPSRISTVRSQNIIVNLPTDYLLHCQSAKQHYTREWEASWAMDSPEWPAERSLGLQTCRSAICGVISKAVRTTRTDLSGWNKPAYTFEMKRSVWFCVLKISCLNGQ